jgi:hypothetical protein
VAVGTTTTGNPGTNASVANTGTSGAAVFNFTIPRGNVGATGPANSLSIGSVTTGTVGTSANATITGTAPSQTLNLTIPVGATGAVGATGPIAIITSATAPSSPSEGMVWFDETTLRTYVRYDNAWVEVVSGYNGADNSLSIGTVTTGSAGASAVATITGSAPNQTLNLTIPRGDKGDTEYVGNIDGGTPATIYGGTNNIVGGTP